MCCTVSEQYCSRLEKLKTHLSQLPVTHPEGDISPLGAKESDFTQRTKCRVRVLEFSLSKLPFADAISFVWERAAHALN